MNCILLQGRHCSLQCGIHGWWNTGDAGAFAVLLLKNTGISISFFFISISFPWHLFSWCLDKALGCGHLVSDTRLSPQAAEGHSTRQELLLSNIPHQIHLPLVQGVPVGARTPQKDRYTGHTALRTLFTLCPCKEHNQTPSFSALGDVGLPHAQVV